MKQMYIIKLILPYIFENTIDQPSTQNKNDLRVKPWKHVWFKTSFFDPPRYLKQNPAKPSFP